MVAPIILKEVTIEGVVVNNVPAAVLPDDKHPDGAPWNVLPFKIVAF